MPPSVGVPGSRGNRPAAVPALWFVTLVLTGRGSTERLRGSLRLFCHRHGPGSSARFGSTRVEVHYVDEGRDGEQVTRSALTWARELRVDLGAAVWQLAGLEVRDAALPVRGDLSATIDDAVVPGIGLPGER